MLNYFFYFFPHCELSHFSPSVYRQWVPHEHNSSYNCILIFLKLCTCFLHRLKMCMCFSYNTCLIFCHFLYFLNFVIFCPQMYRQWVPCDCNFSYSLHVFSHVCRTALGVDMIFIYPTIGGVHIVFSADPVGVASFLHSISLMNGWILAKLTQIYHWVGIMLIRF